MKKYYEYAAARTLTTITGVVFSSQLVIEVSGMIQRKPGYEWVIYACAAAFISSLVYSVVLVVLNTRNKID